MDNFHDSVSREIRRAVKFFVENLTNLNPKNKTGGVLYYRKAIYATGRLVTVGDIIDDLEKYYSTATRKVKQLEDNPEHISSYESRNPDANPPIWGGGIFVPGVGYFAFSGLPELADEACVLKALQKLGFVDEKFIDRVLEISGNTIFEQLAY